VINEIEALKNQVERLKAENEELRLQLANAMVMLKKELLAPPSLSFIQKVVHLGGK
jgi:cell division septum initiation protein DivIVA